MKIKASSCPFPSKGGSWVCLGASLGSCTWISWDSWHQLFGASAPQWINLDETFPWLVLGSALPSRPSLHCCHTSESPINPKQSCSCSSYSWDNVVDRIPHHLLQMSTEWLLLYLGSLKIPPWNKVSWFAIFFFCLVDFMKFCSLAGLIFPYEVEALIPRFDFFATLIGLISIFYFI